MHHGLNFQNMYHLCRFIASLTLHSDLILSSYLPWPLKIDALMGLYWVQIMAAPPKLVTHLHIGKPSTFKYFSEVSEYKVMYWACYSGNWTAFSVKNKIAARKQGHQIYSYWVNVDQIQQQSPQINAKKLKHTDNNTIIKFLWGKKNLALLFLKFVHFICTGTRWNKQNGLYDTLLFAIVASKQPLQHCRDLVQDFSLIYDIAELYFI